MDNKLENQNKGDKMETQELNLTAKVGKIIEITKEFDTIQKDLDALKGQRQKEIDVIMKKYKAKIDNLEKKISKISSIVNSKITFKD